MGRMMEIVENNKIANITAMGEVREIREMIGRSKAT